MPPPQIPKRQKTLTSEEKVAGWIEFCTNGRISDASGGHPTAPLEPDVPMSSNPVAYADNCQFNADQCMRSLLRAVNHSTSQPNRATPEDSQFINPATNTYDLIEVKDTGSGVFADDAEFKSFNDCHVVEVRTLPSQLDEARHLIFVGMPTLQKLSPEFATLIKHRMRPNGVNGRPWDVCNFVDKIHAFATFVGDDVRDTTMDVEDQERVAEEAGDLGGDILNWKHNNIEFLRRCEVGEGKGIGDAMDELRDVLNQIFLRQVVAEAYSASDYYL